MAARYDDAVAELHQVPHGSFVTERKRLAAELKSAGDKTGAARLGKLPRPPISAWVANQLWWHARDAFDAMLETATKLRGGDLGAAAAHRETLAKLRGRAAAILGDAGHGATEATLRRVMTTLSAVAATGGFDPDPPGALSDDRDPPGFETMGIGPPAPERAPDPPAPPSESPSAREEPSATRARSDPGAREEPSTTRARSNPGAREEPSATRARLDPAREDPEAIERLAAAAHAEEQRRHDAEAAAERRRADQEAARKHAERQRVEAALRTATGDVEHRQREVERLRRAVEDAEARVEQARAIVADLEAKLVELA